MQLAPEDSFRLNVLLNQSLLALRIDENRMMVHGLTEQGETHFQLNPTCRDELYLRQVRELLSTHILGSPRGFPVYLKRWTRMGQTRDQNLEQLLKLGEPEAVVAVVNAKGLTHNIAQRAWWASPCEENARHMLQRDAIANTDLGKILAQHLIEFLPFEEDAKNILETVSLVLRPGLIDEESKLHLWRKGQRKKVYMVGFLQTLPNDLPEPLPNHNLFSELNAQLNSDRFTQNPYAQMLYKIYHTQGQTFLNTVSAVITKLDNQDVAQALFKIIENYFASVRPPLETLTDLNITAEQIHALCRLPNHQSTDENLKAVLSTFKAYLPMIQSMLILSCIGESTLSKVFAHTDAIGTLLQRKIKHLTDPIHEHLIQLQTNS